jgi:hypothetical protein
VARLVGARRFGARRGGAAVFVDDGGAANGSFTGEESEGLAQGVSCAQSGEEISFAYRNDVYSASL